MNVDPNDPGILRAMAEGRIVGASRKKPNPTRWLESVIVPVPPSANNLFVSGRHGKRFPSKEYKAWRAIAIPIMSQMIAVKRYPVRAIFVVIGKLRKGRDLDNALKGLLDCCKLANVILDDDWSHVVDVAISYRPEPGGDGVRVAFEDPNNHGIEIKET